MEQIPESQIRERAHELWEKAGRPQGGEIEFLLQAERELTQEDDGDSETSRSEKN